MWFVHPVKISTFHICHRKRSVLRRLVVQHVGRLRIELFGRTVDPFQVVCVCLGPRPLPQITPQDALNERGA